MKSKQIIKNIIISIIVGILLGFITEYALILNISWLIQITQSYMFWGMIITIIAFISKDYKFSIINPIIVMSLMSITYYTIRFFMSGYTNIGGLELFALTGLAGTMYIGTLIYLIKNKLIYRRNVDFTPIYYFISMTSIGIISTIFGFRFSIKYNLFYNIDLGIIIGFILGIISVKLVKNKK